MRIRILTVTHKTPTWITAGCNEYLKRLQSICTIELIEIPAEKRTAHADIQKLLTREGKKIISAINPQHLVVALEIKGNCWSTEELAAKLKSWQDNGQTNIDFLIGGPDGLSTECLQKSKVKWSLSNLTFPHALVRVLLLEQIYRGFCVLKQHPYHR